MAVRHRTVRSKGCLSNKTAFAMVFKLAQAAEKHWRRLDRQNPLPKVILGVRFTANRTRKRNSSNCRMTSLVTKIRSKLPNVQELIPGGGECQFSYAALCKEGGVLASLTTRSDPRSGEYKLLDIKREDIRLTDIVWQGRG